MIGQNWLRTSETGPTYVESVGKKWDEVERVKFIWTKAKSVMKLAKVNGGHWSDDGTGHGYDRRFEFIDDCVGEGKIAVSFVFPAGNPFDHVDEAEMKKISASELKQLYQNEGIDEGKAKNAADQITRFRDWPHPMPLLLYRGRNTIARFGYLDGSYEFNPAGFMNGKYSGGYQHMRDVKWAEVPEEINRSALPDGLSKWAKNPQSVLDYTVEPRSEEADFLSLAWGFGFAMSELSDSQRRVLR